VVDTLDRDLLPITVPDDPDSSRVLVQVGGSLHALSAVCPHEQGDLREGTVSGGVLWCPVHGAGFDCRTGRVVHPPATSALAIYPVLVDGEQVYVRRRRV
jgi:nitrite reductase/ring-hydroxylating ferredoxin subunit